MPVKIVAKAHNMHEGKALDTMEKYQMNTLLETEKCCEAPNVRLYFEEEDKHGQHRHRYFVNILIILFGISCWIGVHGVFVELPLLVILTPESSALPIYIVILIQLANVVSTLYVFLKKFAPRFTNETAWISGLLVLDTVAMGLLGFFYDVRTTIVGVEYSIVMLILVFLVAIVGTCSPVLFLPYLHNFEKVHIIPYFIGQGLGGVIASGIALIQGVGSDSICPNNMQNSTRILQVPDSSTPNFSPTFHFTVLAVILACSTCAFWILEYSSITRHQRVTEFSRDDNEPKKRNLSETVATYKSTKITDSDIDTAEDTKEVDSVSGLESGSRNYLCVLMGLVCLAAHGYLPSIQAYSSLPYGNVAYHLVVTLAQFADPIACGLASWLPTLGREGVTMISSLAFVLCSYVTWLAISSPMPPWHDTTQGIVLLVIAWILLVGLISYAKVAIATIFRQQPGNKGLYYIGIASQIGSCCGAIITFGLVNFTTIFTPYIPCDAVSLPQ